ncbi:hypothetical protein CBS101457_000231 [Exobasidium rhododendri]|nr:hypothetical protein CBS101457_000231 [Exobasidium rhododendri]
MTVLAVPLPMDNRRGKGFQNVVDSSSSEYARTPRLQRHDHDVATASGAATSRVRDIASRYRARPQDTVAYYSQSTAFQSDRGGPGASGYQQSTDEPLHLYYRDTQRPGQYGHYAHYNGITAHFTGNLPQSESSFSSSGLYATVTPQYSHYNYTNSVPQVPTDISQQARARQRHGAETAMETNHLTYGIDIGYAWKDENELCWDKIGETGQQAVISVVSIATCWNKQGIRDKLADRLTALQATAILSGHEDLVIEAIKSVCDLDRLVVDHPWRRALTREQSEELVHKLAVASGRDAEDVRTFLSTNMVPSDVAVALLLMSDAERIDFAFKYGLMQAQRSLTRGGNEKVLKVMFEGDPVYAPWKEGTNSEQRKQIVQTVMRDFPSSQPWAYSILSTGHIQPKDYFGLQILHKAAEEDGVEKVRDFIVSMTGVKRLG